MSTILVVSSSQFINSVISGHICWHWQMTVLILNSFTFFFIEWFITPFRQYSEILSIVVTNFIVFCGGYIWCWFILRRSLQCSIVYNIFFILHEHRQAMYYVLITWIAHNLIVHFVFFPLHYFNWSLLCYLQRTGDLGVLEGLAVAVRGEVPAAGGVHWRCAAWHGASAGAPGPPLCRGKQI